MFPSRAKILTAAFLVATALSGCGASADYYAPEPDPYYQRVIAPGRVPAANGAETALLSGLADLAPNEEATFGADVFIAGTPYMAASGLVCRSIVGPGSAAGGQTRLACTDQTAWFFVPDVHGSEPP